MTIAVLAGILSLTAMDAQADDGYALAKSNAHKLQVLADGGPAWCKPTVRLRMVLESDSPDLKNTSAQTGVMNLLKAPISTDCKAATAAELTVFEQGAVTGTFKATADGGWVFVAIPASTMSPTPVTQKAEPSPVAPPPQQIASAPNVIAPPPAPAPLPREINMAGALVRLVHDKPALSEDDGILRWWALHRFPREYQQVSNQEFKLQPLLQKAKVDLVETVAQANPQTVTATVSVQFGNYDFDTQQFPITTTMQEITLTGPCCFQSPNLPNMFTLKIADLESITSLPMEKTAAQVFIEKRSRWGGVNRGITLAVTVKLDPSGFSKNGWNGMVAVGTLESATFFSDQQTSEPIYHMTSDELEKMRVAKAARQVELAKAEAERQAELRRQQILAQREQTIKVLTTATPSVKLANWISDGQVDFYSRLSNLRSARAAALVSGKPVAVNMLVQAGASGKSQVDTKWPGKLQVSVSEGQAELSSSGWYLVHGLLTVPDGDSVPPAQLTAQTIYACTQPKCAEATDAAAIVDRKIANLGGAN